MEKEKTATEHVVVVAIANYYDVSALARCGRDKLEGIVQNGKLAKDHGIALETAFDLYDDTETQEILARGAAMNMSTLFKDERFAAQAGISDCAATIMRRMAKLIEREEANDSDLWLAVEKKLNLQDCMGCAQSGRYQITASWDVRGARGVRKLNLLNAKCLNCQGNQVPVLENQST